MPALRARRLDWCLTRLERSITGVWRAQAETRPLHRGAGLRETRRDFGPIRPRRRRRTMCPGYRRPPSRDLAGRAASREPSRNVPRKRQRRRGLSAASTVNRGAGGVCNRPSNSGGPLCPPPQPAWERARADSGVHPGGLLGAVRAGGVAGGGKPAGQRARADRSRALSPRHGGAVYRPCRGPGTVSWGVEREAWSGRGAASPAPSTWSTLRWDLTGCDL